MTVKRRKCREVSVGNLVIGGGAPLSVQTMTKAAPDNIEEILRQINAAADLGCDVIRLAIPNMDAVAPFAEIKKQSPLPLVADIHFSPKFAVAALEAGADKVRINPGNMKNWEEIGAVVSKAKELGRAMRIGVNSGSIRPKAADGTEDTRTLCEAMVEEALYYIERIEGMGFTNFVVSLKASDAPETIEANSLIAPKMDYPLHLGVTHAGSDEDAMLKSAVGVGGLLAMGIGDTIRLSFTGSPESEVVAGKKLLRAAGVLKDKVEVVSCPTCGRCKVDLMRLVKEVNERLSDIDVPLTVAVMGCEVNGPGEAKEADIGIAAGKGKFALFRKGKLDRTLPEAEALDVLCSGVAALAEEYKEKN